MTQDKPKRMGRPPKAEKDKRANVLRVCLTDAERQAVDTAARTAGQESSTWARDRLLRAANR